MKCNKCEAELEEGVTLCPECGCDNAPAEEKQEAVEAPAAENMQAEDIPEKETAEEAAEAEKTSEAEEIVESEKNEIKEGKMTPGKITLLVVLAVAAIAVIVALVAGSFSNGSDETIPDETVLDTAMEETVEDTTEATIPADTGLNDSTCKGTYTVSDEEILSAKDTVVATLGDAQLTNSRLQIYYWMQFYDFMSVYGSYASLLGMDYTQPLDTQLSPDGIQTWQQYFLNGAVNLWHSYSALSMDAEAAGYEMDAEYAEFLDSLKDTLEESAAASGYESAEQMIQADMGVGASIDEYIAYMREYYLGYLYYDSLVNAIEITDEEVEAYYTENEAYFVENGVEKTDDAYVAVRHILLSPEGGTTDEEGNVTYSDEEWEACRASAQALLDQWAAGDATEESFAILANENSMDTGSNTNGGLYEDVYVGQMVEPFENWCFDETRQYGDTGLVQTTYGYHIMFFVSSEPIWAVTARDELLSSKSTEILETAMDRYALEVNYSEMALGYVDMSQG